jgi:hypothetical protein
MTFVGNCYDSDLASVMLGSVLFLREVIGDDTIADADSVLEDLAVDASDVICSLGGDNFIGTVQLRLCGL